jgi:cob(I)alamin adenosyltransferase
MIPMDIKKAQFRIEHLSGCSTDSKRCVIFGIANISRYFEMARVKVRKLERNIKKGSSISRNLQYLRQISRFFELT